MTVDLHQIITESQFTPSGRQIRARVRFWEAQAGEAHPDMNLAAALELGAPSAISKWWAIPGFADWWTSLNWEKEEAHRMLISAMHKVSNVLRDEDDSGRVLAAAKEAREIYSKLHGSEQKDKFLDDEVSKMSRDQLEAFITRSTATSK